MKIIPNNTKSAIILFIVIVFLTKISLAEQDTDMDGIPDSEDVLPYDYDNDGMPDTWEKICGLKYDIYDANDDTDKDSVINIEEYRRCTNPIIADEPGGIDRKKKGEFLSPTKKMIIDLIMWYALGISIVVIIGLIVHFSKKDKKKLVTYIPIKTPITRRPMITISRPIYKKAAPEKQIQSQKVIAKEVVQPKEEQIKPESKPKEDVIEEPKETKYEGVFGRLSQLANKNKKD